MIDEEFPRAANTRLSDRSEVGATGVGTLLERSRHEAHDNIAIRHITRIYIQHTSRSGVWSDQRWRGQSRSVSIEHYYSYAAIYCILVTIYEEIHNNGNQCLEL